MPTQQLDSRGPKTALHRCHEGESEFFSKGGTMTEFNTRNTKSPKRWEMDFGLLGINFDIMACPFCGERLLAETPIWKRKRNHESDL